MNPERGHQTAPGPLAPAGGEILALSEAVRLLTGTLDLSEVLQRFTELGQARLGVDVVRIWLWEGASGEVHLKAQAGVTREPGEYRMSLRTGEGLVGWIVEHRLPLVVPDLKVDPRLRNRAWMMAEGLVSFLGVPLLIEDAPVGILAAMSRQPRDFSPEDVALAEALAAPAAIAIRNARLYHQAEERARKLTALSALTRLITSATDSQQVFHAVAQAAATLLGARMARVWVDDPASGGLRARVSFGIDAMAERFMVDLPTIQYGRGVVGSVFESRVAEYVIDVQEDPRFLEPRLAKEAGLHAFAALPLISGERVVGVLAILFDDRRQFAPEEKELMSLLADQAAIAIGNAQLLQELRTGQDRLEALLQVSRQLSRIQALESLLSAIAEACGQLLDSNSVGIRLVEGNELMRVGTWGDAKEAMPVERLKIGESLTGIVAATGEPLLVMDPANDPRLIPEHQEAYRRVGARAFLGVPVKVGERVVGVLSIRTKREEGFSREDLALATAFASQAAVALENARLVKSLQQAVDDLKAAQDHLVRGETLRAVGELASGMAHHLNNLLAVVLGRTQLLLRKLEDPEMRRSLEIVERAALDGAEVVRRVHGFGRMQPVLETGPVDLNHLAREVLELTRPLWQAQAQVRGIQIQAALEAGPIPSVTGDLGSLREVFLNLVFNAIDALPEGGRISVKTRTAGGRVHCTVADTGVGMSEEVRQRVMEPFFTTKGPKSRGLGLSFTYGIIKRHGGEIAIESGPGKGTAVTISVPFAAAAPPPPAAPPAQPSPARILVIDDEPEVRAMLAEILAGQGHTVSEAADGAEGLSMFQAGRHDLVFTDLAMPGASGWQVADQIKAISRGTPVILVTGWLDQQEPATSESRDVDLVLFKPFETEQVATVVSRALARAR
ncbi:MAG: GAF domain-containing protein [Candidatus Rokubacteria bacterium]|nr:GAF domain-containing protein [Candidatus Rokubacteria bacterium]